MRVKVAIVDVPTLILRVSASAQVGMQKGPDVGRVRAGERSQGFPEAPPGGQRISERELTFVLVDLRIGGIEVGIDRCECRQARGLSNHWTGWDITDKGEIRVDAQR